MKQTDEQYFSNIPQEPTIYCVSGCCPVDYTYSTYTPPKGFKTCPRCNGKGEIKTRLFDEDGRTEWRIETCPYCNGYEYVTEEEFNKYWETKQNDNI